MADKASKVESKTEAAAAPAAAAEVSTTAGPSQDDVVAGDTDAEDTKAAETSTNPTVASPSPPPAAASPGDASTASPPAPAIVPPGAPAVSTATIEVDEAPHGGRTTDDDEAYGSDDARSTTSTSLSSSIRDYTFENSRRYHKFKEGKYHFPNDEPEQEREDMRHCMMVHVCLGKLHKAPLKNPQTILDVGTGTGIWAIDMGDEYPEAEVIGIDLSPIQPSWVPPNVRFLVDDAEAPWVSGPNSYDYIHIRNMSPAVKDWPNLMAQCYEALRPGGWIEIQDLNWIYACDDDSMKADYAPAQMATYIRQGLQAFGIQVNAAEQNPIRLKDTGFTDIRHTADKVPVGVWPRDPNMKTIGLYNRSSIYDGLQGITMGPLTRGLKWSPEEVELFLVRVRQDLLNPRIHSYVYMHTLCGQKPL